MRSNRIAQKKKCVHSPSESNTRQTERLLSKEFSNILIQNRAYSQKQAAARTCSVFQGLVLMTGISFQHSI